LRDDTSKKIGNENYLNIGGAFNNLQEKFQDKNIQQTQLSNPEI